jgi:hypothetical protein
LFFKTVNLFNRFKKCKFLAPKGRNQKTIFCNGRIPKEIFIGGKAKMTYFTGDNDLFTLNFMTNTQTQNCEMFGMLGKIISIS